MSHLYIHARWADYIWIVSSHCHTRHLDYHMMLPTYHDRWFSRSPRSAPNSFIIVPLHPTQDRLRLILWSSWSFRILSSRISCLIEIWSSQAGHLWFHPWFSPKFSSHHLSFLFTHERFWLLHTSGVTAISFTPQIHRVAPSIISLFSGNAHALPILSSTVHNFAAHCIRFHPCENRWFSSTFSSHTYRFFLRTTCLNSYMHQASRP